MVYSKSTYKTILVGPLPPGWGGARISFKIFYEYLIKNSKRNFKHFDLPIRYNRDKNPPGKINHFKTFFKTLHCAFVIPSSFSIIVFGSRNFCCSYGLLLLLVSKLFRKPFYIRFFGGRPVQSKFLSNSFLRPFLLRFLSLADRIIVQTYVGASEFPEYMSNKLYVIVAYRFLPTPINNTSLSTHRSFNFVYAGSISPNKGIYYLINVFRHIHKNIITHKYILLNLYGSANIDIIKKIQPEENVFYHGNIDNQSLCNNLIGYDVFVFPSVYVNEGHPGAIVEALMAGLPIVASDLPGIKEVVRHKENGLLVEAGNTKELAEAMQELIENEDLRNKLARGALESSQAFKAETVLPQLARAVGILE